MAVTVPTTSERNFIPSSTAMPSLAAGVPGTVVSGQTEYGPVPTAAAVVKDQVTGVAMALPAASFAPETVAVYVVLATRAADGVRVAVWATASYATAAGTVLLAESLSTKLMVDA